MGDMHRRLGIALSLSALLIGGALTFRLVSARSIPPTLAAVPTTGSDVTIVDSPIASVIAPAATSTSTEPLTTTDLIGRQMLSDYLNLAAAGEATDDSVAALAAKYVDNIGAASPVDVATSADIHVVPD